MSLFDNHEPYNFKLITTKLGCEPLKRTEIYGFKGKGKHKYIVNVDCFLNNIYIVKFYLKSHALSKDKYNLLTQNNDVIRILHTIVSIGRCIHKRNPYASFGFIGSPTIQELSEQKNYQNTQRFRIYSIVADFYFGPNIFDRAYDKDFSAFLLINKKATKKDPERLRKIVAMFINNYDFGELFPSLEMVIDEKN